MRTIFISTLISLLFISNCLCAQAYQKNRAIILTDIENEPDDSESMVRLLLYSNVIDIKGIIATTSVHMKNVVYPESIKRIIRAYGKVRANLEKNEAGYPTAEDLIKLVKQGLPEYGMQGVGEGKDSHGSEWIIKVLEENDERPLWICVWGGPNTLAQALYKIKSTKSRTEAKKLIAKLRVYTISDQDDSGIWIRKNFPDLFYIVSPGGYGSSTWSGMNQVVTGINNIEISNKWLVENIQESHGPLGAQYPDVAYGMEGDTPSWLNLIPNGLNYHEHPNWGGWGGRYELYEPKYSSLDTAGYTGGVPVEPEPRAIWTNAVDTYVPYVYNEYGRAVRKDTISFTGNKVTLWRWRNDFQNDFAARIDWCTKTYKEANHPPVPAIKGPDHITVKSGGFFSLVASGTTDPDGDNLSYLWFQYLEAGTCKKTVSFVLAENDYRTYVRAPDVNNEETTQIILKVTDKGKPPLSRYKRIFVKILP
jgi:hypothetical protein